MADAKQGKVPEDFYNGSSSQSRVVLAKPRLGGFGTSIATSSNTNSSSSKTCNPFGSVLRPAQLKPANNPFVKITEPEDTKTDKDKVPAGPVDTRLNETKDEEAPKFVPLGSSAGAPRTTTSVPTPAQPTTSTSSSGFVFGQNLSERVVIKENVNNGEASLDHISSNGTSELLFTSAVASTKENAQVPDDAAAEGGEGLAAAAAEYERSHARPPPPATYCTMTGEEDEINVIQISCRLFAWESGSWRERGRGVLRLNDGAAAGGGAGTAGGGAGGAGGGAGGAAGGAGGAGARLVARVSGSLRVVLNTKLWPDMVVERAGNKSLRITAADAQQQVKLFLIMGAPGDIAQLHRALMSRISLSKRSSISSKEDENSQRSAERLVAAADENDYLENEKSVDDSNQENDVSNYDEEQTMGDVTATRQNEDIGNDSIVCSNDKTEDETSNMSEDATEDKETKALKRKEPVEDETSSKRQCQEL